MFIDTHCHPYLAKDKNQTDILDNFEKSQGTHLISIGTNLETSQKSIDLALKHNYIYATVGIHPTDTLSIGNNIESTMQTLENYIQENSNKVVGIGETGLDYHWVSKDPTELQKQKEIQKKYFIAHIHLAKKYNLPIIVHNRNSGDDVLQVLKETQCKNFIIHCFSEDIVFAQKCFEISSQAKMSFSGIVTFKNAKDIAHTATNIPLQNILIETDAPYLTPDPYRGKQENEPAYTEYVLKKIIELRSESPEIITQTIYQNSLETFRIKNYKAKH